MDPLPTEIIESPRPTGLAVPALPVPRAAVAVRAATMADLPAIDALQKQYGRALGFFPRQQWEGYIRSGWVLVAEADETGKTPDAAGGAPSAGPALLGYCASRDRYQKRDELGAVFQMCVSPTAQRGLVGATLLREVFARSSYGCRLYCCWCAQDLTAANRFWESMGFVPLAFRAGSRKKDRVHIFWQRRVRAGDEATPWWFPSHTGSGALREDRVVLPIPPGVRWHDPMPRLLPTAPRALSAAPRERRPQEQSAAAKRGGTGLGGLTFGRPRAAEPRTKPPRAALTPEQAAMARELRDRWQEAVAEGRFLPVPCGKYDVARAIERAPAITPPLLAA